MVRFASLNLASWKLALALVAFLGFPFACGAEAQNPQKENREARVIVSVTDLATPVNRAAFSLGGQFSNVVAVSWTQRRAFSRVSIDASIVSEDPSFASGTAYLMTSIGPGTTLASEVVPPANFTAPFGSSSGDVPLTALFSGLTLILGMYYLVLTARCL